MVRDGGRSELLVPVVGVIVTIVAGGMGVVEEVFGAKKRCPE